MEKVVGEIDILALRKRFPLLGERVNGSNLIYLDNAATTQKPASVIEAMSSYYKTINSNVHRGVHQLSARATKASEEARDLVQKFIKAQKREEIIFTSGTTESINLVAKTLGRKVLSKGDEVVISTLEHHSNIVPWQMICQEKGAHLKVVPLSQKGEILIDEYEKLLSKHTKIVAISHVSNTLGTINPIKKMCKLAHAVGAHFLVDGAQALAHVEVDVQDLNCDFYCGSAHKMYGPTGVGFLYGKESILEEMPPFLGGGEMIKSVSFEETTYNELPFKFEAGTPPIAEMIGFAETIRFWNSIEKEQLFNYEEKLLRLATESLKEVPGLKIYGEAKNKTSVISFNIDAIHPFDLGTLLDQMGIAIRTGHHCTEPLMNYFQIPGTARASFGMYNTEDEINTLKEGLLKALALLS